jgi:hypothetical protein
MRRLRRAGPTTIALILGFTLLAGCLPTQPSAGRGTPVRKVLVLGDSMTFGLFSATPRLHEKLVGPMADRGISLVVSGGAGDTPLLPWPGSPPWSALMKGLVADHDPDMVIVQSTLFPDPTGPRQTAYRAAMTELLDLARSRGAHVYVVSHPTPPGATDRTSRDVAQAIQRDIAASRGISTIPLDWWLGRCAGWASPDGWHLSEAGQRCHALAVTAAVDQLRARNGPR